jgi:diaminopimelate epimerase
MEFVKMHGLGNDFIVIHSEQDVPENAAELSVRLCDRHFGIGADGLVFILPSSRADAFMRIFNADGSESEQCGNAIRCVAKYLWDRAYVRSETLTVETKGAGVQPLSVETQDGKVVKVRVDMGEPIFRGRDIPIMREGERIINEIIETHGRTFQFTAVSMGNPHCVIEVEDTAQFDVAAWGSKLEQHAWFPRRTNVEFIRVISPERAVMRVWERGSGETLACGSGACAVLVASVMTGRMKRNATIDLPGGELFIEWDESNNHVYMTGQAQEVFEGRLGE